jgi:hypothetical protein
VSGLLTTLGCGESPVLLIGVLVAWALRTVAQGFREVWLERSRRKSMLAVMDRLRAWDRERGEEQE